MEKLGTKLTIRSLSLLRSCKREIKYCFSLGEKMVILKTNKQKKQVSLAHFIS
jgi:hypothetical protein